jgi:predicted Rossmann fold nucleotide-binding protein DprA/Smf involved in DNA uptake
MHTKKSLLLACLFESGFSHRELRHIIQEQSIEASWNELKEKCISLDIPAERKKKIILQSQNIHEDDLERIIQEKEITIITLEDPSYPESLKTIGHIPALLYVR